MGKTKTKILAILMSVVMAFSMISVGALAAFADDMEAQAYAGRDSGVVYDSVYGVLGGEYALMLKEVTYESTYYTMPMTYTDTITDVVRADGTVVLHTSSAAPYREQDMNTGANTDFALKGFDINGGYLMVQSKTSGKTGLRTLNGEEITPCVYDSFSKSGDTIVGIQYDGKMVKATFLTGTGASMGSLSYESAEVGENGYRATEIRFYGNLVQLTTYVNTEDGYKSSRAFAEKSGSSYEVVKDIKDVISSTYYESDSLVVVKTDGYLYVYDGSFKKVMKDDDFTSAGAVGSFMRVNKEVTINGGSGNSSGTSTRYETYCYTLSGKRIGGDDDYIAALMKTHAIMRSYDNEGEEVYTLYDATGTKVKTLDLPGDPEETGDNEFFTVAVRDAETDLYDIIAYKPTGEVWKDLDVQLEYRENLYPQKTNGEVAGYALGWDSNAVYFDLDLNKLDGPIADNASKNTMADGTQVNAKVSPVYENGMALKGYTATVTDANGNAITRGNYTLGIYVNGTSNYNGWNQVRRGTEDVWFATDKSGKWGAIDSKGNVVVPFEYEGYFDAGKTDTSLFLVKRAGQWYFYDLAKKAEGAEVPMIPTVGVPDETQRLKGDNALGTMKEIVEEGCFEPGGTIVLAQLEGYWDALTAAGIAGLENAPVLMTPTNGLAEQTEALLKELKPSKIIVCGGQGSMPDATVNAAAKAAGTNPKIVRCAGDSAIDTAIDIYKKGEGWAETALIATVGVFQDALAAAPVAYANRWPIFLASYDWAKEEGTLSEATIKAMQEGGIKKAYIAGGSYWISDKVIDQLKAAGIEFGGRMAGDNAMITSEAIAEFALTQGMSANGLGLATVNSYYDALCGAALCGRLNSVMLLVDDANSPSIKSFIAKHASQIDGIWVFGGNGTINDATLQAVGKALG